ncbi:ATP-grasp domain-containing protein [Hydrogenophaga sp. BPS33]|uniref:ATP-grasp domain-containing protein n=1 Tax=Hydrogenophaga sp. BPS33 TaxID=2651974 RepID=UPI0013584F66|nr:ATP-grasp domain-containing protein [Hydrogenophaga sp. BPS33]
MIRLNEATTKQWLRDQGLPVPWGVAAQSPEAARATVRDFSGATVVKAMVPTGRRGKAGAVLMADDAEQRASATDSLIGRTVNGYAVKAVYVEERMAIEAEYYLAFLLSGAMPRILLSRRGGVDIEDVTREDPDAIVQADIDPLTGLTPWAASELWLRAGVTGPALGALADLSSRLYQAFCAADGLMLEINPLAIGSGGRLCLVGAMMGVDPHAMFRHPEWSASADPLPDNPRERAVALANRLPSGGECQYVELAGDIGLLVGGGGAGLYQHDLVLSFGGAPANHCVTPPTSADTTKLRAVLTAILDNPALRGLLVGFNFAQMARTDIRVRTLVEVLDEKQIDTRQLPIVIRLFGAGEEASRAMIAGRPNIHYVPRGTTLKEAARMVVELTAAHRVVEEAAP